jgi:metal-sulfur cluster biosynthetic enzyme
MSSLLRRLRALWKRPAVETPPVRVSPPLPAPPAVPPPARLPAHDSAHAFGHAQFVNDELVYTVLRTCHDPEIPLNIVDLGLIYGVRVDDDRVEVTMTLTTPGCGMGGQISRDAEERILALPGIREAKVEIVWDPPWTPERISPDGRKTLGLPE